jgi:hypothetical protein
MLGTAHRGAVGYGSAGVGLAGLVAVLIGNVTATTANYWTRADVIAALVISGGLFGVGLWSLGSVYLGWPWPRTHEERAAERAQREHDALLAHFSRVNALQELLDELENNRRHLRIQLDNERTFGVFHPANAWTKNRHVLNASELFATRELVHDAYLRTQALNQRTQERYDAASHDEINDPKWNRLTEEETTERAEALEAVEKALSGLQPL